MLHILNGKVTANYTF